MANLVPPLLSDTPPPPPPPEIDDPDDDEFGDFAGPHFDEDLNFSPPGTPLQLPLNGGQSPILEPQISTNCLGKLKDFCDKRKIEDLEEKIGANNEDFATFSCNFEEINEEISSTNSNLEAEIVTSTASDIKKDNFATEFENFQAEISCKIQPETSIVTKTASTTKEDNNFDDFEAFAAETSCPSALETSIASNTNNFEAEFDDFQAEISCKIQPATKTASTTKKDNNFDDFEAFAAETSCPSALETSIASNTNNSEPEFDDFGDFSCPLTSKTEEAEFDDDFGDFATFSAPLEAPKFLLLNDKEALEKATEIIQEMFPEIQKISANFQDKNTEIGDKIFEKIKNITETHALAFQWQKSASQKLLLKSLNIDLRNILGWNNSMPKFAANLSLAPLEPIKSEISASNSTETLPNCSKEATATTKKKSVILLRETHISSDVVSFLEPTIVTPELSRKKHDFIEEDFDDLATEEIPKNADDEFGEFKCSLPQPLKPLPPATGAPKQPQIVWPDPGITDDEIGRFEALGQLRHKPLMEEKKDEEEWTDFVSSTNQKSPLNRVQKLERSSTPDLPLSVLNLGVVQPNGVLIRPPAAAVVKNQPLINLNLISNQFDQYATGSKDDEEWSDFVSASGAELGFSTTK